MSSVTINFANGKKLTFQEGQMVIPIGGRSGNRNDYYSSQDPYTIGFQNHSDLVSSTLDLFLICDYFTLPESRNKAYSVSSVVSVEEDT